MFQAKQYKTGGSCGHRHVTEEARDNCQRQILDAGFSRSSAKRPAGGGKKRGLKACKMKKRSGR